LKDWVGAGNFAPKADTEAHALGIDLGLKTSSGGAVVSTWREFDRLVEVQGAVN